MNDATLAYTADWDESSSCVGWGFDRVADRLRGQSSDWTASFSKEKLRPAKLSTAKATVSQSDLDARDKLRGLADRWYSETQFLSSTHQAAMIPEYQEIIGKGREALSFVLGELATNGGQWFWALRAITGEDPVPTVDRGRYPAMREHWLRWARTNGISLGV